MLVAPSLLLVLLVLGADAERQMLDALAQQPVAVGVNIHALQFYDSGVVTIDDCPPADADPLRAINHAVRVIHKSAPNSV